MELRGHRVALHALVGSWNYNLNRPELIHKTGVKIPASDKDYKAFVYPTFEELYKNKMFSDQEITKEKDVEIHDIRKLIELFFKANLNYLEPLLSKEIWIEDSPEMNEIYALRYEIFNMNLPKLYNSCGGTFLQKMKLLPKGTEGTQVLVDLFDYDTKQGQHAYRNLDFCVRYEALNFKEPEKAFRYEGQDLAFMIDIKEGFFEKETFERFVNFYHDAKFKQVKEKFHAQPVNFELKEHLDNLVMKMVEKHIKE